MIDWDIQTWDVVITLILTIISASILIATVILSYKSYQNSLNSSRPHINKKSVSVEGVIVYYKKDKKMRSRMVVVRAVNGGHEKALITNVKTCIRYKSCIYSYEAPVEEIEKCGVSPYGNFTHMDKKTVEGKYPNIGTVVEKEEFEFIKIADFFHCLGKFDGMISKFIPMSYVIIEYRDFRDKNDENIAGYKLYVRVRMQFRFCFKRKSMEEELKTVENIFQKAFVK